MVHTTQTHLTLESCEQSLLNPKSRSSDNDDKADKIGCLLEFVIEMDPMTDPTEVGATHEA